LLRLSAAALLLATSAAAQTHDAARNPLTPIAAAVGNLSLLTVPTALAPVLGVALPPAVALPAPRAPDATKSLQAAAPRPGAAADAGAAFDGGPKLNILMAAAESVPFIKTGGLADVVDAVARGFAERGHRVMLVMPMYRQLRFDGLDLRMAGHLEVPLAGKIETARLWTARREGVDHLFIDHPGFFLNSDGPYSSGSVYGEDANESRFAYFSRAALEAARAVAFRPDVVHAHDWHAALIPAYLKRVYANDPFFAATRSVVTIHNIAFQGHYSPETAAKIGFDPREAEKGGTLEHNGGVNYLKGGLVNADAITTVSPTYAKEIQSGPTFGMGLEKILQARSKDLTGIINGIDPKLWDPSSPALLGGGYGLDDVAAGKAANKQAVQRALGLSVDPTAPLFAIASRLSHQKGIDVALEAANSIVAHGGQVVVSGSGESALEERVAEVVKFYSHYGRVGFHRFDEAFVLSLYAAADFLLMPSRFEPCGLSQLISQRFGALPIVARTGGLVDTVTDLREDAERGNGLFVNELEHGGIWETVTDAFAGYRNPAAMAVARRTAMRKDASWGPSIAAYESLFRRLVGR
jgi:starch synthase